MLLPPTPLHHWATPLFLPSPPLYSLTLLLLPPLLSPLTLPPPPLPSHPSGLLPTPRLRRCCQRGRRPRGRGRLLAEAASSDTPLLPTTPKPTHPRSPPKSWYHGPGVRLSSRRALCLVSSYTTRYHFLAIDFCAQPRSTPRLRVRNDFSGYWSLRLAGEYSSCLACGR